MSRAFSLFGSPLRARFVRWAFVWAALVGLDGCGTSAPDDAGACPLGQIRCVDGCVDVATNLLHCGQCYNSCGAGEDCQSGKCSCPTGESRCGDVCVSTNSDPLNCGSCSNVCGADLVCSSGQCLAECESHLTRCGQSCVDIAGDPRHCGRCGSNCEVGQACTAEMCTCSGGRLYCGAGCTDAGTDPLNCGRCGQACDDGLSPCLNGQCQPGGSGSGGGPGTGGASSSGGSSATGGVAQTGGAAEVGGSEAGGGPGTGGGPSPGCDGRTGFYVNSGKLYDKNCEEFILRGVNYPYAWYSTRDLAADMAAMASVGSNVVRVVAATGDRWTRTPGATLTAIFNAAKAQKMVVVIEVHDTTGYSEQSGSVPLTSATSYWLSSDVKSALMGQEAYVILNIGNEAFGNDAADPENTKWVNEHVTAVQALRNDGYHHTLMVDAPNWGQDWRGTMRDGGGVPIWNADPEKNVVFSVHMYDEFDTASDVTGYYNAFLSAYEAPLVVGEFAADHGAGKEVDEATIMMFAESLGIGYMGWSWSGNGDGLGSLDITANFDVAQLSTWGNTLVNGTNGLKATSELCSVF